MVTLVQGGTADPTTNTATVNATVDSGGTQPLPPQSDSWRVGITRGATCTGTTDTYYLRRIPDDGTTWPKQATSTSGTVEYTVTASTNGAEFAWFYMQPSVASPLALSSALTTLIFHATKGSGSNPLIWVQLWDSVGGVRQGSTPIATSSLYTTTGSSKQYSINNGGGTNDAPWPTTWNYTLAANHELLWVLIRDSTSGTAPITFFYNGNVAADNQGRFTVCTESAAHAVLDKRVDSLRVTPGSAPTQLVYTMSFSNPGRAVLTGAQIIDTLPAGVTYVSALLNGVAATPTGVVGQQYTFSVQTSNNPGAGILSAGQSGALTITVNVNNPMAAGITSLVNTAILRTTQTGDVTDTATTAVTRPRLAITKSVDQTLVVPGETVTYTLQVLSCGDAAASSVTVSDNFPDQSYFTYVPGSCTTAASPQSPTPTLGCSESGGVLTATATSLAVGESFTVTFQMLVGTTGLPAGLTVLNNLGTVCDSLTDPANPVTSNTVTVTISASPNLLLTKDVDPPTGPVSAGEILTYTMTLQNVGSAAASGVQVTDPIPAFTTYVAGSVSCPTCSSASYDGVGNQVVYGIGTLAAGASRTMTFQVRVASVLPDGSTPVDNTATATASDAASRQASANLTADAAAVLTLNKTAPANLAWSLTTATSAGTGTSFDVESAVFVAVGDYLYVCADVGCTGGATARVTGISGLTVTVDTSVTTVVNSEIRPVIAYSITYQNTGDANATGVVVTDTLPGGTSYVTATPAPSSSAPPTYTWDIAGAVAPGAGGTIRVWAYPTGPGSYLNTATVDSDQTSMVNDTATTHVGSLVPDKLTSTPAVENDVTGAVPLPQYTVTVTNTSGAQATNLRVIDAMAPGFTYNSTLSTTGGNRTSTEDPTVGDNPVTWGVWTLDSGETLTITFDANLADTVGSGTYQNAVKVTANGVGVLGFDELLTTAEDVTVNWRGPDHVVVSRFDAVSFAGRPAVRWETDAEVGSQGFWLMRLDPRTGWFDAVVDAMLPSLRGTQQGGTYAFADPGLAWGGEATYLLVELEAGGREVEHGPYVVKAERTRAEAVALGEYPTIPGFAQAGHPFRRSPQGPELGRGPSGPRAGSGLRIAVREPGIYRVTPEDIAGGLGISPADAEQLIFAGQLRLTLSGRQLPWLTERITTTTSRSSPQLLFYGEGIVSPYARDRFYLVDRGRGSRMGEVGGSPGTGEPATGQTFRDIVRYEQDVSPLVDGDLSPDDDIWYWGYAYTTRQAQPGLFSFAAPGLSSSRHDAALTAVVQGGSNLGFGTHHLRFTLNGLPLGEVWLGGYERRVLTFAVDSTLFTEAGNTLEMVSLPQAGVSSSLVMLDSLELEYERRCETDGSTALVRPNGEPVMVVQGFSNRALTVLDVSDPTRPRLVSGARVRTSPLGVESYEVLFVPPAGSSRFLVASPDGIRRPVDFRPDQSSSLRDRSNEADYVMITTAALAAQTERLADHRRETGLRAMVVLLDDVYDEFSGGQPDPRAVRSFLDFAYRSWRTPPTLVALVGEGTFDYKDVLGLGTNLVPPALVKASWGLLPSDNHLADVAGDDGVPEMAVGRIPVETADQLSGFVDKIIAAEADLGADWSSHAVLVADNPDSAGSYTLASNWLSSLLPASFTSTGVYLEEIPAQLARDQLLAELNTGAGLVTYVGHGGLTQLAHERILSTSDVPALHNGARLPVVAAMTCHINNFWIPGYPSLGEELVLVPNGGARATWAGASLSYSASRTRLGAALLRSLFALGADGPVLLGDAVLQAMRDFAAEPVGGKREVLESQVLLADPATRLPASWQWASKAAEQSP